MARRPRRERPARLAMPRDARTDAFAMQLDMSAVRKGTRARVAVCLGGLVCGGGWSGAGRQCTERVVMHGVCLAPLGVMFGGCAAVAQTTVRRTVTARRGGRGARGRRGVSRRGGLR